MLKLIIPNNYFKVRCNLIELLTKRDLVQPSYEYIPGATFKNIANYKNHPTMLELRQDIINFATDICDELKKLSCVQNAKVNERDENKKFAGLSTYIDVSFKKPDDKDYLRKAKMCYTIKIRLSDHYDLSNGLEDYDIDMCYRMFAEFQQDIIDLVLVYNDLLEDSYSYWQQNNKITKVQKQIKQNKYTQLNKAKQKAIKRGKIK